RPRGRLPRVERGLASQVAKRSAEDMPRIDRSAELVPREAQHVVKHGQIEECRGAQDDEPDDEDRTSSPADEKERDQLEAEEPSEGGETRHREKPRHSESDEAPSRAGARGTVRRDQDGAGKEKAEPVTPRLGREIEVKAVDGDEKQGRDRGPGIEPHPAPPDD